MKSDNQNNDVHNATSTEFNLTIGELPEFQNLALEQSTPHEIKIVQKAAPSDNEEVNEEVNAKNAESTPVAKQEPKQEPAKGNDTMAKKTNKKKKKSNDKVVATIKVSTKATPTKSTKMESFKKAAKTGLKVTAGAAVVAGAIFGGVKYFGRD